MLRVTWFLQKEKESGHKQRGKESTQLGESKQSKQRYQQGGLHWTHEHYTCSIIIIIIIIIIITIGRFVVGELSIPQIQKKMSSAADHSLFFFLICFVFRFFFVIVEVYPSYVHLHCMLNHRPHLLYWRVRDIPDWEKLMGRGIEPEIGIGEETDADGSLELLQCWVKER